MRKSFFEGHPFANSTGFMAPIKSCHRHILPIFICKTEGKPHERQFLWHTLA